MLVLTRQLEQEIIIDDRIRVKVLSVSGGQVRLGIEAPPEVTILRREVYDEVSRENRQAAAVRPEALIALRKTMGGRPRPQYE
jgi:carbon storage regulator